MILVMSDTGLQNGYCHLDQDRIAEALACFRAAKPDQADRDQLARKLIEFANNLQESKRSSEALDLLQFVTELPDDDAASEAHYRRALICRRKGLIERSVLETVKCLARADHFIAFEMIESFRKPRELEALKRHLPLLEEVANSPVNRLPYFYVTISDAHVKFNNFARSAFFLSRARDLDAHWQIPAKRLANSEPVGLAPSSLIIGAMKCGTTMLFESLIEHPQIGRTVRKEINFFENPQADFAWYLNHFVRMDLADGQVAIDASVSYYTREILGRIDQFLPDAKFIFMVRDPARRAISHYFHNMRHGNSNVPIESFFDPNQFVDLADLDDDEAERKLFDITMHRTGGNVAIAFGFYYYFIKRWIRHFGHDRFLFLTLQELKNDPHSTLKKTFQFIGVDDSVKVPLADPYAGEYPIDREDVKQVQRQLTGLYAKSRQKFEQEFGIEIGTL